MSNKTGIEWTEATWNPVTGCSKVSQGCKHCYAERDWARLSKISGNVYTGRAFTDVMCHPERLDQPLCWKKPRRIFVNSMSDLFHESVPDSFIAAIFAVMASCPQHTFQILTKRPERMLDWFKPYSNVIPHHNVWLGVSIEDQDTANERIPLLLQAPAAVRWVSAEPLLGKITIFCLDGPIDILDGMESPLHWVVAGGESGPQAWPMHPDWVRSLRDQCQATGVPFFFKQWGEWQSIEDMDELGIMTTPGTAHGHKFEDGKCVYRCGKRKAGRELDGRIWDEYPQ